MSLNYYVRDGRWLGDSEVRSLPEYRLAVAKESSQAPTAPKVLRWLVLMILVVTAVLTVVAMMRGGKSM